jgi:spore germination protein GerM
MPQPFAEQVHDRGADFQNRAGRPYGTSRRLVWVLGLAAFIAAGAWMRTLPAGWLLAGDLPGLSWQRSATVNLYFFDGAFLFPVSRRLPLKEALPRAALEALLAGPARPGRVKSAIPAGVEVLAFSVTDGVARIDLSRGFGEGENERMALATITETLTRMPGVTSVAVSVQGQPVAPPVSRRPLMYFPSANGLVAVPGTANDARGALAAYLSGPPAPDLTGVPANVRLLSYDYDAADHLVSVGFSYTPALRALALEQPERTRMLLLGLIATLTEFPDVRAVRLDFGGQSRLGLGECSDLLRSPQPRPALLNDERLID